VFVPNEPYLEEQSFDITTNLTTEKMEGQPAFQGTGGKSVKVPNNTTRPQ
jgi:hypothetical protein